MKLPGIRIWGILISCLAILVFGLIYVFSPSTVEQKRIGILLYLKTPTTLSFVKGLTSSLAEQGYYPGKNLKIQIENTGDSKHSAAFLLKKMVQKHPDLLITTGKDLTIEAARSAGEKPIIFALISDPIRDETIKTLIKQEKNITGVSYFTPYDRTLELSARVIPRLKRLTVLLTPLSTWPDLDKLKEASASAGVECQVCQTSPEQIPQMLTAMRGKTDAVYLPNDIQLIMKRDLIQQSLYRTKLPAISNNFGFQYCSVLTYIPEPETMGQIAAQMVVKIFHGANTKYMPTELSSYFKLVINLRLLRELNLKINEDILSYANEIIQ